MKYFRNYPWGMQMLLFLLMTFTFLSGVSAIVLSTFTKITGYPLSAMSSINSSSSYALIKAVRVMQGLQNSFIFMLPALVFAYSCHPRPLQYLGLRRPGKNIHFLLAVTLMLGAMPVFMFMQHLMQQISFGAGIKAEQEQLQNVTQALMTMPTVASFISTLLAMSLVPGFGEELFFRGVMMRFSQQRSRSFIVPALFSAAVFSYAHANVYGLISIFLAGLLLAYIYYFTGSLWCSILAHMFFNGSQVTLQYVGNSNAAVKAVMETDALPIAWVLAGAAVFAASLWLLVKNSTPLPANWADDYTPQELEALRKQ